MSPLDASKQPHVSPPLMSLIYLFVGQMPAKRPPLPLRALNVISQLDFILSDMKSDQYAASLSPAQRSDTDWSRK